MGCEFSHRVTERQYTYWRLFTRNLTKHLATRFKIRYSPLRTCRNPFSAVDLFISEALQVVTLQGTFFSSIDVNYCGLGCTVNNSNVGTGM